MVALDDIVRIGLDVIAVEKLRGRRAEQLYEILDLLVALKRLEQLLLVDVLLLVRGDEVPDDLLLGV